MLRCDKLQLQQGTFSLHADFQFPIASLTALIGPSGAGKSTLLSAMAGFLPPVSGRILVGDNDLTDTAPGQRPMSMLFQDNNLFPHLTIAQNVGLGLRPKLRLSAAELAQVADALRQVGLTDFGDRLPAELSGGQQSRAALARVLLADRPIVLLDEPFAALGPGLKHDMLDLVQSTLMEAGRTVVMVTHDPDDAKRVAEHVVLIADHLAHTPTPTQVIFDNPPRALGDYLGAGMD